MKFDHVLQIISREKTPMSIYDFQFLIPHFQVKTIISHCLIIILIKTCSVAIFNSAVLWNFKSDSPILIPWSYLNLFRYIDFQNSSIIVIFLYSICSMLRKGFCRNVLIMYQRRSCDRGQDIWKSSLFSKKATLIIN